LCIAGNGSKNRQIRQPFGAACDIKSRGLASYFKIFEGIYARREEEDEGEEKK
jgi:hypothetical protein